MKTCYFKKTAAVFLAALLCLSLSSCGKDGEKLSSVKKAQESVCSLTSGELSILSTSFSAQREETVKSNFLFTTDSSGNLIYCHTQKDKSDKIVFCEYNDGSTAEQWLIGKGWSQIDVPVYNADNPHRFLALITTPIDKKSVDNIVCEETQDESKYIIALNPDFLNENTYKNADFTVSAQTITLSLNKDGVLCSYSDSAEMTDRQTEKTSRYTLSLDITNQNSVSSVERPELREYTPPIDKQ